MITYRVRTVDQRVELINADSMDITAAGQLFFRIAAKVTVVVAGGAWVTVRVDHATTDGPR